MSPLVGPGLSILVCLVVFGAMKLRSCLKCEDHKETPNEEAVRFQPMLKGRSAYLRSVLGDDRRNR
jgi:hypothetical protein